MLFLASPRSCLSRLARRSVCASAILGLFLLGFANTGTGAEQPDPSFDSSIQPFLKKNCYGCHNQKLRTADLDLTGLKALADDPDHWEKVSHRIQDGTMPPKPLPRPPAEDMSRVLAWIREGLDQMEQTAKPDPGRVTARRLNRAEYNNTVRDLLGVEFGPADDFPQDDSGYGFDNIGDVLSLSPVLMEKYLKAAESVVRTALNGPEKMKPVLLRAQPARSEVELRQAPLKDYDESGLSLPNALNATMRFPADGEYTIRVAIEGRRPAGSTPAQIAVWLDGKQVKVLTLNGPTDGGGIDLFGAQDEFKMHVPAGEHWIAASVYKIYDGLPVSYGGPNPSTLPVPPRPDPSRFLKIPPNATPEQIAVLKKQLEERMAKNRTPANRVWVHYVEALGPYDQKLGPSPETQKKVFACAHPAGKHVAACTRTAVTSFARRAFRRPVTAPEVQPFLNLAAAAKRDGATFEESVGVALQGILVSPDFLFRVDRFETAAAGSPVRNLDQYSLASRLSYFLWSSMPDEELLRVAGQKRLNDQTVLQQQIRRMLLDPKAKSLVQNFAGQWLELRRLESLTPDREKFPVFDDYLRMSIRRETEEFFEHLLRNDLSILDLIDAKYTFVNEKLATFYGIPGVKGTAFRKVDLTGTPRGGVLTHASILTVSSYATRTSPVLRGKWILENILNAPVPPAPPNVPELDEAKIGTAGTLRQQLEEHRKNPACASCHSKMDPLGLAFENFSAIGQYRTHDGKFPIDSSGVLPDGRQFNGPDELRALLRKDSTAFTECVTDKMLTYALGRGLERYDKRTVRQIAKNVAQKDHRFSALVTEIALSLPFQKGRNEITSSVRPVKPVKRNRS